MHDPLRRRSADRLTIYRRAICAICSTDQALVEQVRRTVVHEIATTSGSTTRDRTSSDRDPAKTCTEGRRQRAK
jgi:hypothetical protein